LPKEFKTVDALTLRFGEFLIDSRARRLARGNKDVRLSPKAFDLLRLLLARRPDVLSKDELLTAIWPDTHVIEANLNVVVAEIRRALGDDRHAPRFIRTVHAIGYAFCGEAFELDDTQSRPGSRPASASGAGCWLSWKDRSFALVPGSNVIGRDPRSEVWLDDESVSRRHARISVEQEVASIEDLDSTNGTMLNREPLNSLAVLRDGDVVDIGSLQLTFRTLSNTSARTRRLRERSEKQRSPERGSL
jgi:DNA-binding winged helix-turn-helix (wHTH) protein